MGEKDRKYTIWYDEMDGSDFNLVGKKNANLGEMIKAGIPVSPGFAITIFANDQFLIRTSIRAELEKRIKDLGQVTFDSAREASEIAIRLIENADIPKDIEDEILGNYHALCERTKTGVCPVAVRSSGAISMPGQMETYLNIRGDQDLLEYV